jgi:uncharacterized OsmC-like protein
MADVVNQFTISIDQVRDYEFRVQFDKGHPAVLLDEPPPLGRDAGPSASRMLAAAIGNCLSASLLFCARKAHVNPGPIHADVKVTIVRNENKRMRVGGIEVAIDPHLAEADVERARRCRELFEDFCIVTESVRSGIDVKVSVAGLDSVLSEAAPAQ